MALRTPRPTISLAQCRWFGRTLGLPAFPGVGSMMAGQALIKGSVFSTYSCMQHAFSSMVGGEQLLALDSEGQMLISAAVAGAVASFVATPVERVKLVMQRSPHGEHASALVCARSVIATDGMDGLFFRGLGAMLAREVPSYTFYFLAFELVTAALVPLVAIVPALGGWCRCWAVRGGSRGGAGLSNRHYQGRHRRAMKRAAVAIGWVHSSARAGCTGRRAA